MWGGCIGSKWVKIVLTLIKYFFRSESSLANDSIFNATGKQKEVAKAVKDNNGKSSNCIAI